MGADTRDRVERVRAGDENDLFPISACLCLGEDKGVRAHATRGMNELGSGRSGGGGKV